MSWYLWGYNHQSTTNSPITTRDDSKFVPDGYQHSLRLISIRIFCAHEETYIDVRVQFYGHNTYADADSEYPQVTHTKNTYNTCIKTFIYNKSSVEAGLCSVHWSP